MSCPWVLGSGLTVGNFKLPINSLIFTVVYRIGFLTRRLHRELLRQLDLRGTVQREYPARNMPVRPSWPPSVSNGYCFIEGGIAPPAARIQDPQVPSLMAGRRTRQRFAIPEFLVFMFSGSPSHINFGFSGQCQSRYKRGNPPSATTHE